MITLGIRFSLQFDETASVYSTRKRIIGLGVLWLPIVTVPYWFQVSNYVPCTLCAPPIPVAVFLAWITFLVADCLYQLRLLSKTY